MRVVGGRVSGEVGRMEDRGNTKGNKVDERESGKGKESRGIK